MADKSMDSSDPRYRGIFINLDRETERRQRIEKQLATYNLKEHYVRFPAVDGASLEPKQGSISRGELACFKSHYLALEQGRMHGNAVHILEDDAILSQFVLPMISRMQLTGILDQFDILFTEMILSLNVWLLKQLKEQLDLSNPGRFSSASTPNFATFDISRIYASGTTSYVVGANNIDRVLAVYRKGLETGPPSALDLFIREEARSGRLKLGC